SSQVYGMALGDMDGDGKSDLVVALENGVGVFHGHGDGTFGAESDYGPGNPRDVALADFNGDGRLDIASVSSAGTLALVLNDGSGGFLPATTSPSGVALTGIAVADFNGDGKPDVAACGGTNAVVWLWVAPGVVGPASVIPLAHANGDIAIADMNLDGKQD